jgi:hypothetical protein
MTELMGWVVVVGLAVVIGGIYLLSIQIERHMRDTAAFIISSNKLVLSELKRLTDPEAARAEAAEPTVGVILERRCGHRRARVVPTSERAGYTEQRGSPGRRREDFAVVR